MFECGKMVIREGLEVLEERMKTMVSEWFRHQKSANKILMKLTHYWLFIVEKL